MAAPALPKATISNHYAVCRAAGLMRARESGVQVLHTPRCEEVERRLPGPLAAVLLMHDRRSSRVPGSGPLDGARALG